MKAQRQNSTCSQGNICENVHWYIVIAKGRGGRREGKKKKRNGRNGGKEEEGRAGRREKEERKKGKRGRKEGKTDGERTNLNFLVRKEADSIKEENS